MQPLLPTPSSLRSPTEVGYYLSRCGKADFCSETRSAGSFGFTVVVMLSLIPYLGNLARILIPLLVSLPMVAAAQLSISSSVSPRTGTTDDDFRFVVTVEGTQSAPTPLLTGGDDFSLTLLGPQSSLTIINGDVRSKTAYIYRLTPRKAGELQAPIAEIQTPQGSLTTEPIVVTVTEGAPPGATSPAGSANKRNDFFLQQTVMPDEKVYVGQQLVNAITLYTRVQAEDIHLEDLATEGFWQETLSDDDRSTVELNGQEYKSIQILKSLYPLRSGTLQIPPRKLSAKIPDQVRRSPFGSLDPFDDDLFGGLLGVVQFKSVEIQSGGTAVEVLSLPDPSPDIAPLLTSVPLVGDTAIKVEYPLDVIKVGESKTVTVQVTSEGNLNPVKSLPFTPPSNVKMYEERAESSADSRGPRLKSVKRFRYTLIPLKGGYFTIPGIKLAYFDPATTSYKVVSSSDIAFVAQGGALTQNPPSDTPAHSFQESLAPTTNDSPGNSSIPGTPAPLAFEERGVLDTIQESVSLELGILLGVVLAGIVIVALVAHSLKRPDPVGALSLQEISSANSISELQSLFHSFVLSMLDSKKQVVSPKQSITVDQLRAIISKSSLNKNVVLAARSLLDDLERHIYTGQPDDSQDDLSAFKERLKTVVGAWG